MLRRTARRHLASTLMDPLILFGIGFSTGLSGAMIPGPLFLYTVSEALSKGPGVGIKIALGHLLL